VGVAKCPREGSQENSDAKNAVKHFLALTKSIDITKPFMEFDRAARASGLTNETHLYDFTYAGTYEVSLQTMSARLEETILPKKFTQFWKKALEVSG
jgi:hypothetical protein